MNIVPAFVRNIIAHRPNLVKIVDNIGWLFFDKILRMGVGLFVGVWVARYLGPEQFGLLSFATAFVGLFGAIAGLGLQGIVVRDLVRNPGGKFLTLGTAAVLQLVGGILAYVLLLVTIFWLRPDDHLVKAIVAIVGSVMVYRLSDIVIFWFESQVLSRYVVWVQNTSFLVFAIVKVVLIVMSASLVNFAWVMVGEALLSAILLVSIFASRGLRPTQLQFRVTRAIQLLKDSWPLLLSGMAILIYMKIDQIMLGQMLGDDAVGIYSAATRISEVWYFIPMVIIASVFPAILEAKKHSEQQYYDRIQRLYDLMVWFSVGVALPMTFLSTPIVVMLFGNAYEPSGPVLAIHIWAAVFVFLGVASSKWFITENRQILSFQRTALGAVVNVGLNFILIPGYGPVGAAIATVLSYAIAAFFSDLFQRETRRMFYMKLSALNIVSSIGRIA